MIGLNARMTTLLAAGSNAPGTRSGTLPANAPTTTWPLSTAAHNVTLSNGTLVTVTYDKSGAITSVTTRTGTGHPAPAG
jgi:YD repeat-containing protein